jgi:hypothetical protein
VILYSSIQFQIKSVKFKKKQENSAAWRYLPYYSVWRSLIFPPYGNQCHLTQYGNYYLTLVLVSHMTVKQTVALSGVCKRCLKPAEYLGQYPREAKKSLREASRKVEQVNNLVLPSPLFQKLGRIIQVWLQKEYQKSFRMAGSLTGWLVSLDVIISGAEIL